MILIHVKTNHNILENAIISHRSDSLIILYIFSKTFRDENIYTIFNGLLHLKGTVTVRSSVILFNIINIYKIRMF